MTTEPSEGGAQGVVQKHPALLHFGLLFLLILGLSFSCSRLLTSPVNEKIRESFARQVFVEGLMGPVTGVLEMEHPEWAFLAVISVFPICLIILARLRFGCLSLLLICAFALLWCFIGFIPTLMLM